MGAGVGEGWKKSGIETGEDDKIEKNKIKINSRGLNETAEGGSTESERRAKSARVMVRRVVALGVGIKK